MRHRFAVNVALASYVCPPPHPERNRACRIKTGMCREVDSTLIVWKRRSDGCSRGSTGTRSSFAKSACGCQPRWPRWQSFSSGLAKRRSAIGFVGRCESSSFCFQTDFARGRRGRGAEPGSGPQQGTSNARGHAAAAQRRRSRLGTESRSRERSTTSERHLSAIKP